MGLYLMYYFSFLDVNHLLSVISKKQKLTATVGYHKKMFQGYKIAEEMFFKYQKILINCKHDEYNIMTNKLIKLISTEFLLVLISLDCEFKVVFYNQHSF